LIDIAYAMGQGGAGGQGAGGIYGTSVYKFVSSRIEQPNLFLVNT
jgi:hypothetical protein